ncbi:MAG: hypothetical protein A2509_12295 [Candidatus Edwardsbacteria bacterium RIFOXYD12_FULL_50_11]|uniref:Uncharacterized protein n=1 Tax=Candidatus Edwardsbacteria bacterium GWF2_54_11 TaxID=1817851 RepID=A0A1F5R353_9BACT|nr:MAG: hypothetical protein A2502_02580 [Candidatus Edwardsbacteria bacterium RifOxyC12_full_54_24]OGF08463.1 MAG: hypothetical protein A2024_07090 [Candidatus Edwardsbacteria bacterium GWF2_54_11]OGF09139.1 MAG: hypothetical protein A2273_11035 [Candidatus Edwardsbacteria bacterium RifOxyA12_full_54_48]OGF12337.1 MAG: hypothetical protein A3K15_00560 [Candidatus Edwardsbacteria bacterium GWE2_54_12]OGF15708.1 MAG: hypothetical protein A2509_12295 [Candidatus Edwardsbacteria bacterium RIFOXYD1
MSTKRKQKIANQPLISEESRSRLTKLQVYLVGCGLDYDYVMAMTDRNQQMNHRGNSGTGKTINNARQ